MNELFSYANIQKDAQATWSLLAWKRVPDWPLTTEGNQLAKCSCISRYKLLVEKCRNKYITHYPAPQHLYWLKKNIKDFQVANFFRRNPSLRYIGCFFLSSQT